MAQENEKTDDIEEKEEVEEKEETEEKHSIASRGIPSKDSLYLPPHIRMAALAAICYLPFRYCSIVLVEH
jgi:hypothetical protein